MAGYIGSKASVTQIDGYTKTEADARYVEGDDTLYVDQTNNRVGIATSSPARNLVVNSGSSSGYIQLVNTASGTAASNGFEIKLDSAGAIVDLVNRENGHMRFWTNNSERMRIDSSGNLLVGKTSASGSVAGAEMRSDGYTIATRDGAMPMQVRRLTNDGDLVGFYNDSAKLGSIAIQSYGLEINGESGHTGISFASSAWVPLDNGSRIDNSVDIGLSSYRFDDVYATNGTIQTSDRNEKQDIEELTDAEQRVAVAAKGLLRKFRWKDAVAEKGDEARTHFGIIAQDLQSAFEAEGLDAGDYAMFISTTWWETQTEVPAVEAVDEVLDDEGNVVTEAVEAAEAYTRTDTYDTAEEAPEGATQKTRLGVRYSELLAFIIGAL